MLESTHGREMIGKHDPIICGGGPERISAAITAARLGVHNLLVEATIAWDGTWTSGFVAMCSTKLVTAETVLERPLHTMPALSCYDAWNMAISVA